VVYHRILMPEDYKAHLQDNHGVILLPATLLLFVSKALIAMLCLHC
jgi:hypothetical protein